MKEKNAPNEEQFREICLREAGMSYSVSAVLPVILSLFVVFIAQAAGEGYEQSQWYIYLSFLLPQICFAAAACVYFVRSKAPLRSVFGGCQWQYFLIAIVLQFGLLSLSELNGLFLEFLALFGYEQSAISLPDLTGWNLLPAMLVVAVLPAVLEETVFRGIIAGNFRRSGWGTAATVLISGAMFSLFHTNPAQTVYQFVCGVCFALVALRCGSILPTVVSHFLNNALVLALSAAGCSDFPDPVKLPLYIVSGVCLAASLAYLIFFDKNNRGGKGMKGWRLFFLGAAVGLILCAVLWGSVLIAGIVDG